MRQERQTFFFSVIHNFLKRIFCFAVSKVCSAMTFCFAVTVVGHLYVIQPHRVYRMCVSFITSPTGVKERSVLASK